MPASQSARNENLPRRITQAQVEAEKRKLREQLEQQRRQAERRLLKPELPLPTRIKVAEPPPAIDLPTYNPSRIVAPTPSNVVAFPTRNPVLPEARAAVSMAPLAPPDLPTRPTPTRVFMGERIAGMTPLEMREAELRQLESAGVDSRVRVTPEGVEILPPQKMGRGRAALEGFLRGLALGAQSGSLGTALGAGIAGTAGGAIAPSTIARRSREEEIARQSGQLDQAIQREGALSEIQNRRALADARRNQPIEDAAKAAQAERKERIARLMTNIGRIGYKPDDPNDKASQVLKREAEALGIADQLPVYIKGEKSPDRVNIDGVWFERQVNGDEWRPAVGLPTRSMVNVPGYGLMTPAQARIADATANERASRRERDETEDQRRARERSEDIALRTGDKEQARQQRAADLVGRIEGARQAWIVADRAAEADPTNKAGWEFERTKAAQAAAAAATELNTGYGDLYEAGIGDRGLAYYKERPKAVKQSRVPPGLKGLPTRTVNRGPTPRRSAKPKSDPLGLFN